MNSENQYDAIAEAYRESKQLPFREFVESYSLFEILGDIGGATVLDLACGDGFYTRRIKQAGAREVTGVDLSAEMIRLAEEEERARPLGCRYLQGDAARLELSRQVDLVVAMYLLNYARTREELLRFVEVAYGCLLPGGRFVGFNDNVRQVPRGRVSYARYGFEKECTDAPREGDVVLYRMTQDDGGTFEFRNYYLKPETYRWAFEQAGFLDFQWAGPCLHPAERQNRDWHDFMTRPPVIGFRAEKNRMSRNPGGKRGIFMDCRIDTEPHRKPSGSRRGERPR